VLQPAEEDIRLGELVAVAAGDEAGIEEPVERAQRSAHAQVRIAARMEQLQRLGEELDFADAAFAQLEIDPRRARRLLLGPRLELAHFVDRLEIEILAEDEGREPLQVFFADPQIPGDGPRFEQSEALPGDALRLVIELESADGVDDRPAAPLG